MQDESSHCANEEMKSLFNTSSRNFFKLIQKDKGVEDNEDNDIVDDGNDYNDDKSETDDGFDHNSIKYDRGSN